MVVIPHGNSRREVIAEIDSECEHQVIDILPEQKKIEGLGGNMRLGGRDIDVTPGSLAWKLFNESESVRMRFRHRYEVNPAHIDQLTQAGMVFSGVAPGQPIMQIMELPDHPYFIGTQAHPCLTSRPLHPQPMFVGLVAAASRAACPNENLPGAVAAVQEVNKQAKLIIESRENAYGRKRKATNYYR